MGQTFGIVRPCLPDCLKAAGFVGAWTQDAATGLVVADLPVAQLFGLQDPDPESGDQLERYMNAIHPADRASFAIKIAAASRHGAPIALQYRVRTSSGVRFVHDYGLFTLDEAGRPLRGHGIIIDASQTHSEMEVAQEIAVWNVPNDKLKAQANLLAENVIAVSEIARVLPSARLRNLTDSLLWESGRLLAWVMSIRVV